MIHKVNKTDTDALSLYDNADFQHDWAPKHQYKLSGIVSHSGGIGGGHYVAYTYQ